MGTQPYNEELLHWIWRYGKLASGMQTIAGKKLTIYDPGIANPTDGPDFTQAHIGIGTLHWHGDIEIHWKPGDWFRHGHQDDPNYKSVILHVVFARGEDEPVNPQLPTLCLQSFLRKPLDNFFEGFKTDNGLPCSQALFHIPHGAMEKQIAQAHEQYFEQKVDRIISFYDPELIPSKAWKKMLAIALFDGLGISNNRSSMRQIALKLFVKQQEVDTVDSLKEYAHDEAFKTNHYCWKLKGSRPANHPGPRIKQGCELLWMVVDTPLKKWYTGNVKHEFNNLIQNIHCKPGIGKKQAGILYGTVWLPAIYFLGDLFGYAELSQKARNAWMEHRTSLPKSICKPFEEAGVPRSIYQGKLGTVHQLKRFCRHRNCHRCEVFKSAIST